MNKCKRGFRLPSFLKIFFRIVSQKCSVKSSSEILAITNKKTHVLQSFYSCSTQLANCLKKELRAFYSALCKLFSEHHFCTTIVNCCFCSFLFFSMKYILAGKTQYKEEKMYIKSHWFKQTIFEMIRFFLTNLINSTLFSVELRIKYLKSSKIPEIQKQPSRVVLSKRCSENMQQIYRRTPMPNFNMGVLL